jgi:hypothetical protein
MTGSSGERFRRRLEFAFIAVRQEERAAKAARAPIEQQGQQAGR